MRKIEQKMIQAVLAHTNWKLDNTEVLESCCGVMNVFLHNNHIAKIENGVLSVNKETLKRWPTMTTRSRLRALGADLVSKKGVLFLDGVEV